jgi:hypothetical protein
VPKNSKIDQSLLADRLRRLLIQGPNTAEQICGKLDISQPTLSKHLQTRGECIVKIGNGKNTTYGLAKIFRDIPSEIPIYWISEKGESKIYGSLRPLEGGKFFVSFASKMKAKVFPDLPFFLDPMRARGYLGRRLPKTFPELQLPADIKFWTSEHNLRFWVHCGIDTPGNLIVGEECLARFLNETAEVPVPLKDRAAIYNEIAHDQSRKGQPGSSAAGEQPKLLCLLESDQRVLVKYSPPLSGELGRRWADLLVCEQIALRVCNDRIFPAAQSDLVITTERVFLESQRFDRIGKLGRRAVMPFETIDAEYVDVLSGWRKLASELRKQKRISEKDEAHIILIDMFGELIANSDRHLGNLSCFPNEDFSHFKLAPVYDMLPMYFAPQNSQIVERQFSPELFVGNQPLWMRAFEAAQEFWKKASDDSRISKEFRKICTESLRTLDACLPTLERMPHSHELKER